VCGRCGEPRVGGASRKSMGTTAATSKPYWLMTLLSMVSTSVLDSASRKSSCPASPVPTSPRDSDILSAAEPIRSCSRFVFSWERDRKSTRLNSSHVSISYAVFCLKKKKKNNYEHTKRQMTLVSYEEDISEYTHKR